MRKLPEPVGPPLQNYEKCVQRVGSATQKRLFYRHFSQIYVLLLNYQQQAYNKSLYNISSMPTGGYPGLAAFTTDDFKKLYTSYMVAQDKKYASRKIYDSIKASVLKCPLCGFGEVYEVDHYLPKSQFPAFSVLSYNLIPCCHACNHGKLSSYASTAGQQTLHPFYDDFEIKGFRWLYVDFVSNQNGFEISYYVNPPKAVNSVSYSRVFSHFDEFDLKRRFRTHAMTEMVYILDELKQRFPSPSFHKDVKDHLKDIAGQRLRRNINFWDSALYEALSHNVSFFNGDYLTIQFDPI